MTQTETDIITLSSDEDEDENSTTPEQRPELDICKIIEAIQQQAAARQFSNQQQASKQQQSLNNNNRLQNPAPQQKPPTLLKNGARSFSNFGNGEASAYHQHLAKNALHSQQQSRENAASSFYSAANLFHGQTLKNEASSLSSSADSYFISESEQQLQQPQAYNGFSSGQLTGGAQNGMKRTYNQMQYEIYEQQRQQQKSKLNHQPKQQTPTNGGHYLPANGGHAPHKHSPAKTATSSTETAQIVERILLDAAPKLAQEMQYQSSATIQRRISLDAVPKFAQETQLKPFTIPRHIPVIPNTIPGGLKQEWQHKQQPATLPKAIASQHERQLNKYQQFSSTYRIAVDNKRDSNNALDEDFLGQFECTYQSCHKLLCNNISFMWHLWAHVVLPKPTEIEECTNRQIVEEEENAAGGHQPMAEEERTDVARLHTCPECLLVQPTPYRIQLHYHRVHKRNALLKSKTLYTCNICEKSVSAGDMARHIQLHYPFQDPNTLDLPYTCRFKNAGKRCRYRVSTRAAMLEHYADKHKNSYVLVCPFCLQTFTVPAAERKFSRVKVKDYVRHVMQHDTEKTLFCANCAARFTDATKFKAHLEQHSCGNGSSEGKSVEWRQWSSQITRAVRAIKPSKSVPIGTDIVFPRCMECGHDLKGLQHFDTNTHRCPNCNYSTHCPQAYGQHLSRKVCKEEEWTFGQPAAAGRLHLQQHSPSANLLLMHNPSAATAMDSQLLGIPVAVNSSGKGGQSQQQQQQSQQQQQRPQLLGCSKCPFACIKAQQMMEHLMLCGEGATITIRVRQQPLISAGSGGEAEREEAALLGLTSMGDQQQQQIEEEEAEEGDEEEQEQQFANCSNLRKEEGGVQRQISEALGEFLAASQVPKVAAFALPQLLGQSLEEIKKAGKVEAVQQQQQRKNEEDGAKAAATILAQMRLALAKTEHVMRKSSDEEQCD